MDAPRILRISAAAGVAAYAALRLAALGPGADLEGRDPMSRAMLLAVLVVVPLALALVPRRPGDRWHALVAIVQPIGAFAVVVSLALPTGPLAGALASAWMSFALLAAWLAASRLRSSDRARSRMVAIGLAAGPAMLPIGAAWLVASRMGLRALGFDPVIVLLTAVHFHFAALATPILVACSLERAPHGTPGRALAAALAAVLAGIPLVAAGIALHPALGLAGSLLLAAGLLVHSGVALARVLPTLGSRVARVALAISLASPWLSMPLAIAWSVTQLVPSLPVPLDLDWMLRLHGQANAHGVVTMGLLAWTFEAARRDEPSQGGPQGTSTSPR